MNKFIHITLVLLLVSCASFSKNDRERGTLAGILAGEYTLRPVDYPQADLDDMSKVEAAKGSFALARDFYIILLTMENRL